MGQQGVHHRAPEEDFCLTPSEFTLPSARGWPAIETYLRLHVTNALTDG